MNILLQLKDPVIFLIVGIFLLIKGADWFVDGAANIAKILKIPSLIIGLTLVAMGTSAPEASVSIQAVISGSNSISVGNVIGSNIFNALVIIGVCSIIFPININRSNIKFDLTIIIVASWLLILFSIGITPLVLSLIESIILLSIFTIYIIILIVRSKKDKYSNLIETEYLIKVNKEKPSILKNIFLTVAGLLAIILGGDWVVNSASNIASILGMDEILIGLTIVAIGTSLPELVTSITASRKGENDIAIGNIIGSNIFNILFILGASGIINPLTLNSNISIDLVVMFFAIFIFIFFDKKIIKKQGFILLSIYLIYTIFIMLRNYLL